VPAATASPGDIIAVVGIPDIMIGETLADLDDPRPLPLIWWTVAISMTLGVNTSRWSAGEGHQGHRADGARPAGPGTGRQHVHQVLPTDRPDTWECRAAASWPWPCWWRSCGGAAS
jgi:GTP-binding protein